MWYVTFRWAWKAVSICTKTILHPICPLIRRLKLLFPSPSDTVHGLWIPSNHSKQKTKESWRNRWVWPLSQGCKVWVDTMWTQFNVLCTVQTSCCLNSTDRDKHICCSCQLFYRLNWLLPRRTISKALWKFFTAAKLTKRKKEKRVTIFLQKQKMHFKVEQELLFTWLFPGGDVQHSLACRVFLRHILWPFILRSYKCLHWTETASVFWHGEKSCEWQYSSVQRNYVCIKKSMDWFSQVLQKFEERRIK